MTLTPNERKAELVRLGLTQAGIARDHGVKRAHLHLVLMGVRRSERIEQAIADAIGRPVDEVFPARDAVAVAA